MPVQPPERGLPQAGPTSWAIRLKDDLIPDCLFVLTLPGRWGFVRLVARIMATIQENRGYQR